MSVTRDWEIYVKKKAVNYCFDIPTFDFLCPNFWIKQTHPLFAKILHNTLSNPSFLIQAVREGGEKAFKEFAKQGLIEADDFEKRIILYAFSLAGILTAVHVTGEMSPTEAEVSLGVSLSIWGVSEAKAKKIISRPLVFPSKN